MRSSAMKKPLLLALLASIALGVVVLDQGSKYWVLAELTSAFDGTSGASERLRILAGNAPEARAGELHYGSKRHITVSPSFFRLRYAENPGAAWGMFRDLPPHVRGPLFHAVSIAAVGFIAYYFSKLKGESDERWAIIGLPLVLGGAVGNYLDRLARGFVIDFLEAHWFDKAAWPSFNVADAAICIGVGMLLIDATVRKEQPAAATAPL